MSSPRFLPLPTPFRSPSALALAALLGACADEPLETLHSEPGHEAHELVARHGTARFVLHERPLAARAVALGDVIIRRAPWRLDEQADPSLIEGLLQIESPRYPQVLPDRSLALEPGEVAILGVLDSRLCWGRGCDPSYARGFTREEQGQDQRETLWALVAAPDADVAGARKDRCVLDLSCYRDQWGWALLGGHLRDPETGGVYRDDDPRFQGYRGVLDAIGLERDGSREPDRYAVGSWVVGWVPLHNLRLSPRSSCPHGDLVAMTALVPLSEERRTIALRAEKPGASECPTEVRSVGELGHGALVRVAAGGFGPSIEEGAPYDVTAEGACATAPAGEAGRVERGWVEVSRGAVAGYTAAFYQVPLACAP